MKRFFENVQVGMFWGTITMLVSGMMWLVFVMLPVGMYVQSECLEQGYSKFYVTWNLKQYCITDMGTVVVRK